MENMPEWLNSIQKALCKKAERVAVSEDRATMKAFMPDGVVWTMVEGSSSKDSKV